MSEWWIIRQVAQSIHTAITCTLADKHLPSIPPCCSGEFFDHNILGKKSKLEKIRAMQGSALTGKSIRLKRRGDKRIVTGTVGRKQLGGGFTRPYHCQVPN